MGKITFKADVQSGVSVDAAVAAAARDALVGAIGAHPYSAGGTKWTRKSRHNLGRIRTLDQSSRIVILRTGQWT